MEPTKNPLAHEQRVYVVLGVLIVAAMLSVGIYFYQENARTNAAMTDGISPGCQRCLADHGINVKVYQAREVYRGMPDTAKFQRNILVADCRASCTSFGDDVDVGSRT